MIYGAIALGEIADPYYERQPVEFGAADSNNGSPNIGVDSASIYYPIAREDWVDPDTWALFDARQSGNLLCYGPGPFNMDKGMQWLMSDATIDLTYESSGVGSPEMSVYLGKKMFDLIFRGISYSPPSTYVTLWDSSSEISNRVLFSNWRAASGGVSSNNGDIVFDGPYVPTQFNIMDSSSGGNLLFYGNANSSGSPGPSDVTVFPSDNLEIGFSAE